jgi:hypothetical protein
MADLADLPNHGRSPGYLFYSELAQEPTTNLLRIRIKSWA